MASRWDGIIGLVVSRYDYVVPPSLRRLSHFLAVGARVITIGDKTDPIPISWASLFEVFGSAIFGITAQYNDMVIYEKRPTTADEGTAMKLHVVVRNDRDHSEIGTITLGTTFTHIVI